VPETRAEVYRGGHALLTYGDGLIDSDINLRVPQSTAKIATITAVQPAGRFGDLERKGASSAASKKRPKNRPRLSTAAL
jgi:glucose-1-phosphate cytidylyltransferase